MEHAEDIETADKPRRAYTIPEVAKMTGVGRVTVYRAIYAGNLKVIKGFGRLMIAADELDRFLGKSVVHRPGPQRGYRARQAKKVEAAVAV